MKENRLALKSRKEQRNIKYGSGLGVTWTKGPTQGAFSQKASNNNWQNHELRVMCHMAPRHFLNWRILGLDRSESLNRVKRVNWEERSFATNETASRSFSGHVLWRFLGSSIVHLGASGTIVKEAFGHFTVDVIRSHCLVFSSQF